MQYSDITRYLKPETVSALSNLELIARLVVEGFMTGLHKSPFHGFSVEFSQHRPYMAGDSMRFVDWKVYGRTDRYYIKQFEEETNLRSYILLDVSKSMEFGTPVSKAQYSAFLAAALSYLLFQQRDAVGLGLFDHKLQTLLPPKSVMSYLKLLLSAIGQVSYGKDTNISQVLHEIADRFRRRGLIILISDLLDDPDEILKGLKHFRHDGHEVLVFHILDRKEMDFNYSGDIVFEDLESGERLKTQPYFIRQSYNRQVQEYLKKLKTECSNNRIDYQLLFTDVTYDYALNQYILKRKQLL